MRKDDNSRSWGDVLDSLVPEEDVAPGCNRAIEHDAEGQRLLRDAQHVLTRGVLEGGLDRQQVKLHKEGRAQTRSGHQTRCAKYNSCSQHCPAGRLPL